VGSAIAGSPSQNAHVANIVAAMFLATGQDPAHIVEGAFAYTSMEEDDNGLYAAVTIPNLNIGTIGGGTYLDKFTEARKLISENLTPTQLAGVIAATALAGELSLIAALSTNTLACAHQALGRMTSNCRSKKAKKDSEFSRARFRQPSESREAQCAPENPLLAAWCQNKK